VYTELHGELTDYNILSDMMANSNDKSYLEEELRSLRKDNESDNSRIEGIYNRRRELERQAGELEGKIDEERNKASHLIQSLQPELRDRYESCQNLNRSLHVEMERLQKQLDELNVRKNELYEKVSRSELKKRAAELEEELLEVEEKRHALARETLSQESPEEERARLLAQVKADNGEISTLERLIAEASDQIKMAQNDIQGMDQVGVICT